MVFSNTVCYYSLLFPIQAREALSLQPLLSVTDNDSLMQTVYNSTISTEFNVQDGDVEAATADANGKFDELFGNAESDFSKILLSR